MRNVPLQIAILKVFHQLTRISLYIFLVLLKGIKGNWWQQGHGVTPVTVNGRQLDFDVEWNVVNELEHSTSGVVSSVASNLKIVNNLKKTIDSVF
jgi:hypothetical protein